MDWIGDVCIQNEGRRSWRGEREGAEKGRLFCLYEGNWLGTKNDCIAVLFVCVGFLFGKLIFFNYTRFCLVFFSSYFLFFVSFLSHGSIYVVYSFFWIHGDGETILLPDLPIRTEITDAKISLFTNTVSHMLPSFLSSAHQLVSSSAMQFHHLQKF